MSGSIDKSEASELKTFTIPISSGESNENITIIANSFPKSSKEEIFNQAFKLHSQGKIYEAAKYYQLFIDKGFTDHIAFSNYGVILKDLGKLKDAEILTRKAIKINSNFSEAYSNLSIILRDLGKLKDAEMSARKAIEITPDLVDAHINLAIILRDLENAKDAFDSYFKVIELNPEISNIYISIITLLSESDPSHLDKFKLNKVLDIVLEKKDVRHQELFNAFNFLYGNRLISNFSKLDFSSVEFKTIINNKLIINAFKKIIFKDSELEKVLTNCRAYMCNRIAKNSNTINFHELQFIIALGEQCFLNEYVYSLTEEENISIDKIISQVRGYELNEIKVSILACYFPLYKLLEGIPSLKSFHSYDKRFMELMYSQILEPLQEIELSNNIKKIGSINNLISQEVKVQYEENPYPRWRYGFLFGSNKISINNVINNQIKPNKIHFHMPNREIKVLIAGCGTGNQILQTQRYKNANIIALDLSSSSLSYAQRKMNEIGINNVELVQMDILDVELLEEKFDIIECMGVLHHMQKPIEGLQKLLSVLQNDGFIKLGLYSELARQDIVKARKYIATNKLGSNDKDIRDFRKKIISDDLTELNCFKTFADFYSLSQCRDLCFHSKEHRFTIIQLQELLQLNNLNFLGFQLPKSLKSLYKNYFPEDKTQTNLQNWVELEEKHPNSFIKMYRFWVSKIK